MSSMCPSLLSMTIHKHWSSFERTVQTSLNPYTIMTKRSILETEMQKKRKHTSKLLKKKRERKGSPKPARAIAVPRTKPDVL